MAPWAVRVEGGLGSYWWFVYITTLLLREASWLLYCIVGHPNPASAPSILLVLLEPHLSAHINNGVTKFCSIGVGKWFVALTMWLVTLTTYWSIQVIGRDVIRAFSAHTSDLSLRSSNHTKISRQSWSEAFARQVNKWYAVDPTHTNETLTIDRARSKHMQIFSVCGGHKMKQTIQYMFH